MKFLPKSSEALSQIFRTSLQEMGTKYTSFNRTYLPSLCEVGSQYLSRWFHKSKFFTIGCLYL